MMQLSSSASPTAGAPARHAERDDRAVLLDATPDALLAVDIEARLLHCNRRAATLLGVDRDVPGRELATRQLFAPTSRAIFDTLLSDAAQNGSAHDRNLEALGADGLPVPVEVSLTRFDDATGPWFAICVRDLSAERQVQDQLDRRARVAMLSADVGLALTRPGSLQGALEACTRAVVDRLDMRAVGVWLLDPQGDATSDNTGVLDLEAYAGDDDHLPVRHARVAVGASAIGRIAAERRPHVCNTFTVEAEPGEQPWLSQRGIVAFAGHPLLVGDTLFGVVAMYSPRTLTSVDEESLRAVARKLALGVARQRSIDALRLRAADLARSARALERSNRDLDQFAYITSHDLKAPLRGIGNLASWIEEDLGASVPESVREHLGLLRGRVERMEHMIEGILQYSRAGRVGAAVELVDTGALVREVTTLLAPPDEVRIDVAPDLPAVVAPRLPLQQVFQNLIGNAIKYADRQGPVVRVWAERTPDGVRFSVGDNGPGIAPAYHARIWGVFQRLEARDKVEGTGIGLALVKRIVESVGGSVGVDSDVGSGATFHFTWPVGDTSAAGGA